MKKISKKTIKAVLDKFGYCKEASIKKKNKNVFLLKNAKIERLTLRTVIKMELGNVRVIQKAAKKFKLVFIDDLIPSCPSTLKKNGRLNTRELLALLNYQPLDKAIEIKNGDFIINEEGKLILRVPKK